MSNLQRRNTERNSTSARDGAATTRAIAFGKSALSRRHVDDLGVPIDQQRQAGQRQRSQLGEQRPFSSSLGRKEVSARHGRVVVGDDRAVSTPTGSEPCCSIATPIVSRQRRGDACTGSHGVISQRAPTS
jgi:hypothetical protein